MAKQYGTALEITRRERFHQADKTSSRANIESRTMKNDTKTTHTTTDIGLNTIAVVQMEEHSKTKQNGTEEKHTKNDGEQTMVTTQSVQSLTLHTLCGLCVCVCVRWGFVLFLICSRSCNYYCMWVSACVSVRVWVCVKIIPGELTLFALCAWSQDTLHRAKSYQWKWNDAFERNVWKIPYGNVILRTDMHVRLKLMRAPHYPLIN